MLEIEIGLKSVDFFEVSFFGIKKRFVQLNSFVPLAIPPQARCSIKSKKSGAATSTTFFQKAKGTPSGPPDEFPLVRITSLTRAREIRGISFFILQGKRARKRSMTLGSTCLRAHMGSQELLSSLAIASALSRTSPLASSKTVRKDLLWGRVFFACFRKQ